MSINLIYDSAPSIDFTFVPGCKGIYKYALAMVKFIPSLVHIYDKPDYSSTHVIYDYDQTERQCLRFRHFKDEFFSIYKRLAHKSLSRLGYTCINRPELVLFRDYSSSLENKNTEENEEIQAEPEQAVVKEEDPHAGMVYNPVSETWSFGIF